MFALPKWITDIKKLFGTADGKVLGRVDGAWQFLSSFVPSAHSQDASSINVDTTNFALNLSAADDTAQKALETLDALVAGGGGVSIPESVEPPENPEEGDLWIDLSQGPESHPYLSNGNLVEKKVITADCNSVTFTGLDSLVDGDYYLYASVIGALSTSEPLYLYINNDVTTSNYVDQYLHVVGSTVSGNSVSTPDITTLYKNGSLTLIQSRISVVDNTAIISSHDNRRNVVDGSSAVTQRTITKVNGSVSNVTSLQLKIVSGGYGIKAGSTFTLYKSNSAQQLVPYNPVDITSRTSDYPLKPGEVVCRDYTNTTSVPLYVATQEGEYEMSIIGLNLATTPTNNNVTLSPNNTTYANAIKSQHTDAVGVSITTGLETRSTFGICYAGLIQTKSNISTFTQGKSVRTTGLFKYNNGSYEQHTVSEYWENITTPWISMGTLTFPYAQSGKIIIKRII